MSKYHILKHKKIEKILSNIDIKLQKKKSFSGKERKKIITEFYNEINNEKY